MPAVQQTRPVRARRLPASLRKVQELAAPLDLYPDRDEVPVAPLPRPDEKRDRYPKLNCLDDLKDACGIYGKAAAAEAQFVGLRRWAYPRKRRHGTPDFGIDAELGKLVLALVHEAARYEFGYPCDTGMPLRTPALYDLSPDCQSEARAISAEMAVAWLDAKMPCLQPSDFVRIFHYVHACIRNGTAIRSTDHLFKAKASN